MRLKISFFIILLISAELSNSQHLVRSRVIDSETGAGLENANVIILGTTKGTTTKADGSFEIDLMTKKQIVVISHVTYQSLSVELNVKIPIETLGLSKVVYAQEPVNLRLGEYDGPLELKLYDEQQYAVLLGERRGGTSEFTIVENPAEFPGGFDNLKAFFVARFKYPVEIFEKNGAGRAYIIMDIKMDGVPQLHDIKIMGDDFDDKVKEELARIVGIMPKWFPAEQQGEPVEVRLALPILYAANGYSPKTD